MLLHPVLSEPILITQAFGKPSWDAVYSVHNGIDYGGVFKVGAARAGIVSFAGKDMNPDPKWKGGYGNYVVIDHGVIDGTKVQTLYAHLESFKVKVGDHVQAGQVIGISDSTGYSTGPHLHFGVKRDGIWVDPAPLYNIDTTCEPMDGTVAEIIGMEVNMRKDPGLRTAISGVLFKGTQAEIVGEPKKVDGITWIQIQLPPMYVATSTSLGAKLTRIMQ